MLACIPTKGNAGLEDTVHDHFGSAPYFTLYDSESDKITVLENRNAHHSHGTCHPMNQLTKYHINCVVCSGMGRRAIEALNSEGIKIYQASLEKVSEVVERLKSGELAEMDPATACQGHGQMMASGHDHACGQVRNPGRGSGFGLGRGPGGGFSPKKGQDETET